MPPDQDPLQSNIAPPPNIAGGLLQAVLLSPDVIVFATNAEGILTYTDGRGLTAIGFKPGEGVGQHAADFFQYTSAVRANVMKVLRKGEPSSTTAVIKGRYFERYFVPSFDPDGKVTGLVGFSTDITERHQADEELLTQKELLNNIFDSIPEISHVLDLDLNIVMANRASRNIFDVNKLLGVPCYQAITGSEQPCPMCPVLRTYQSGEPAEFEWYDEQRDLYQALNSFPLRDHAGNIVGAVEMASDVTEKRKAQQALKKSEALLSDLFSCISDGIFVIDREYTILRSNKAMEEMYAECMPLIGKKCYETSRLDCVCPNCPAEKMFDLEKSVTMEHYEEPVDDKPGVWLDHTAHPLIDQTTSKIIGAISVIRDITERKAVEIELQQYRTELEQLVDRRTHELGISEARLRSILETSSAAILFADWQGNITYVNQAFEELLGYSEEELYGQIALEFTGGTEEDLQVFRDILAGKSDFDRITAPLVTKDGRGIWADISASVVRGYDPTETQLISIIVDVTERQRILEELHRAKITAEDASQAKSLFLATMSHEMRTPLNGVIGLSDLLLRTPLLPKQLEYAKLIKTSGNTLLYLINDILDFSKIEAGKFELENIAFDLHSMVESVLGILSAKADEQQLALVVTFEPKVPRPVRGDSGRLRQVLINMVGNGLKFTKWGGVRVHVSVEEIREEDILIRFEVTDTGIGIPEERIHRLFQPFSQVDASSAREYGGTGLGLAISRKLIELLGGTVGVQSVEGQGSTFWFNVALGCSPEILECMRAPQPFCVKNNSMACYWNQSDICQGCGHPAGLDLTRLSDLRVLVVSANDIQRQAIKTQLESWRMPTETRASQADAWESLTTALARKEPYRLIVVDTDSANCPGARLIDRITGDDRLTDLVVIALVPLTAASENAAYREKGVKCCSKPVSCSSLFEVVVSVFLKDLFQSSPSVQVDEMKSQLLLPKVALPHSLRALVAEDNRINQIVIVDILHNAGIETKVVVNGLEACDALKSEPFDIVLMDCQMPQMDGYEATAAIRAWEQSLPETTRRLPIIALTANATTGDEEKCLRAGMDAYCSKPINPRQIVELIEYWTLER